MPTNKLAPKPAKAKAAPAPAAVGYGGPKPAEERKWRAEDALRTLTRADEIRKDAGLMRDVRKCASEQVKTIQGVMGKGKR